MRKYHPHANLQRIRLPKICATVTFDQPQFVRFLTTSELGQPLYWYNTLDSTNTQLWRLLEQGTPTGTVVIAAQQQAGRGQWGRTWLSDPGGLYLSVALAPQMPALQSAQLTLATAWGIATELRSHGLPVELKWPNDLMLQDRKLGGILTETAVRGGMIDRAVIGIGINWSNPVPETGINLQAVLADQPGSTLHALEQLAAVVINGVAQGNAHWQVAEPLARTTDYLKLLWKQQPETIISTQL